MNTVTTKVNYTKSSKTFSKDATTKADTFVYGRLVGGVTVTQHQPLTYRALQAACKAAGISAKGSANALRKALWMSEHGDKTPSPVPLTRRQQQALRSGNENHSHTQDMSIDVSQDMSQETTDFDFQAAYGLDTAVTYEVPCEPVAPPVTSPEVKAPRAKTKAKVSSIGLSYRDSQKFVSFWRSEDRLAMPAKNIGWQGVEENISFILNQPRFWGWAETTHGKATLAAMGVSI